MYIYIYAKEDDRKGRNEYDKISEESIYVDRRNEKEMESRKTGKKNGELQEQKFVFLL